MHRWKPQCACRSAFTKRTASAWTTRNATARAAKASFAPKRRVATQSTSRVSVTTSKRAGGSRSRDLSAKCRRTRSARRALRRTRRKEKYSAAGVVFAKKSTLLKLSLRPLLRNFPVASFWVSPRAPPQLDCSSRSSRITTALRVTPPSQRAVPRSLRSETRATTRRTPRRATSSRSPAPP